MEISFDALRMIKMGRPYAEEHEAFGIAAVFPGASRSSEGIARST